MKIWWGIRKYKSGDVSKPIRKCVEVVGYVGFSVFSLFLVPLALACRIMNWEKS
jgi:hypothetical protein